MTIKGLRPIVWFFSAYIILVTIPVIQVKILDQIWRENDLRIQRASIGESKTRRIATNTSYSCRRTCPRGRINKIMMINNYRAGLLDREDTILWLANIAGFFCAKVYVQTPYFSLEPGHNNDREIDRNVTWGNFYHVGDNVLEEIDIVDHYVPGSLVKNTSHFRDVLATRMNVSNHHIILSESEKDIITDFAMLMNDTAAEMSSIGSSSSVPWIWGINKVFWHFFREVNGVMKDALNSTSLSSRMEWTQRLPTQCDYVGDTSQIYSPLIEQIVQSILDDIRQQHHPDYWGFLHIRRGDAQNNCDTSMERMTKFLHCSLRDTKDQGNLLILFSSDEKDQSYRSSLMTLLDQHYKHVTPIDLDVVVEQHVKSLPSHLQSNYMTFAVELAMRKIAPISFALEQRRQLLCPDCVDVHRLLTDPSVRPMAPSVIDTLMVPDYHAIIRQSKKHRIHS